MSRAPIQRGLSTRHLALVAYFIVSGGPFGLEDAVAQAGYAATFLALLIVPLVWSVPTAFMVGELASALPEQGGFYAWTKRAFGPFWGFFHAHVALVTAAFDLAIYPTLFASYLSRLSLWAAKHPMVVGAFCVALALGLNWRGVRFVGRSAIAFFALVLAPFAVLLVLAPFGKMTDIAKGPASGSLLEGLVVVMWNYTGWDNASTIAQSVENPGRAYPRAIFGAVGLVVLTYVGSLLVPWWRGVPQERFSTGGFADVATWLGYPSIGSAIAIAGALSPLAMLMALLLSYAQLPVALAEDGFLPQACTNARAGLVIATGLALVSIGLPFSKLVLFDILLFGVTLMIEFASLVALRRREPELVRPFRVPGGTVGAVAISVPPFALAVLALVAVLREPTEQTRALVALGVAIALGPVWYAVSTRRAHRAR